MEAYTQYTQNVAALERASDRDITIHPGQDVEYVVVDDQKSSRERMALAHESIDTYDSSYSETAVIRVGGSVLSPIGVGSGGNQTNPCGIAKRRNHGILVLSADRESSIGRERLTNRPSIHALCWLNEWSVSVEIRTTMSDGNHGE